VLYNYKTLFQQVMDPAFPGYIGGFNRFRHYHRGFTPSDTDIVTPNNDTPCSWAWLDLRAEPMVVSVPASPDRYYVLQWFDLYTHNFAYIGSRATGTEAGDYLLAGPDWRGPIPDGIKQVLHSETEIIGTLTRTAWTGPDDLQGLVAMQRQYRIRPLSEYLGEKPPEPARVFQFPAWDESRVKSIGFINYLNFVLHFAPTVPSEEAQYGGYAVDADGKPLDATKAYVLHFGNDQVPPVKYFWSVTMYDPQRELVDNPIDRYAIGSRTKGLKTNTDGSIDIYLQHKSPDPDKESNWLPTPASGSFFFVLRMYGPEGALAEGDWKPPTPTAAP
jgi:hypothetical protein